MKLVTVYNLTAGSAIDRKSIEALYTQNGITCIDWIAYDDQLPSRLNSYRSTNTVIACIGGDGTINATAKCLIDSQSILLPLPGGTLNHFVKDLGKPVELADAIRAAVLSQSRKVDVASVNGRYFLNNSGIGIYPMSLLARPMSSGRFSKWIAMFIGSVRALISFKLYEITVNGRRYITPFLFIGNNRYNLDSVGNAQRTRLDGGLLTIFIVRSQTRSHLLKVVLLALIGKVQASSGIVAFYQEDVMVVTSETRVPLSYDGEVQVITSPLHYRIHKKALNIL